jgi:hypothetical protein
MFARPAFANPNRNTGAFAPAVRDQRAKSAALSLSWTSDPLLDQPAAEVGIDQTAFGRQQGFDERPIGDAFAALKTGEGLGSCKPSYFSHSDERAGAAGAHASATKPHRACPTPGGRSVQRYRRGLATANFGGF